MNPSGACILLMLDKMLIILIVTLFVIKGIIQAEHYKGRINL